MTIFLLIVLYLIVGIILGGILYYFGFFSVYHQEEDLSGFIIFWPIGLLCFTGKLSILIVNKIKKKNEKPN